MARGLRRMINHDNEILSCASNIAYQVKTVFRNPCYPHCCRPNWPRLLKIFFWGAAISYDTRMYKSLPTKHTKRRESFTTQIPLHWCASRVWWAAFLCEPSVLSASRAVGTVRQKEKPRGSGERARVASEFQIRG